MRKSWSLISGRESTFVVKAFIMFYNLLKLFERKYMCDNLSNSKLSDSNLLMQTILRSFSKGRWKIVAYFVNLGFLKFKVFNWNYTCLKAASLFIRNTCIRCSARFYNKSIFTAVFQFLAFLKNNTRKVLQSSCSPQVLKHLGKIHRWLE